MLPDSTAAHAVVERLRPHATRQVVHPSGRPWVLGAWSDGAVASARTRTTAAVVLGQHAVTRRALQPRVARLTSVDDVDDLAMHVAGSVHVMASVGGDAGVQGTVTGVRRVYRATVDGLICASDRADVLAFLRHASVDPCRLAVHLLEPPILHPVAGQSVWRGVSAVPPDHLLVLAGDHGARERRRWTPPAPERSLEHGAAALRDALTAAVSTRVQGRDLVSCDLGGIDSTAVCCVAATVAPAVVAYTAASPDPLADDVAWARRTVAARPQIEHHVIPADQMPLVYHGVGHLDTQFDEPCSVTVDRDRGLAMITRAADRGSDLHIVGYGGDELLYGSLAHVNDSLLTRPRLAVRHLRGFTAKYRWPRRRVLGQLADRRSYAAWLAGVADAISAPAPPASEPLLAWGFEPHLPPWTTPDAAAAARELIRDAAVDCAPAAPSRGQHRELEAMRFVSRITRQLEQMSAGLGVTLAAPYYDDRVVDAGLGVQPLERVTPWRYKPLAAEAMRGIVPDVSRERATKANGTVDEETGLRRHRADVLALWEDARLEALGLIDAAALRELCAGPLPPHLPSGVLYQTIACETWLRSLERADATVVRGT
jgi:asparagine synthase (glutamine-hydrolysing)